MDLFIPEEVAEICSAACRTARYDEYLGLLESAMEDYEDWQDRVQRLSGPDRSTAIEYRNSVAARVSMYAQVAAAYRPVVDPAALVEQVVNRLAELVRLVPVGPDPVRPAPTKTAASATDRPMRYDPYPAICCADPSAAYGAYASQLDDGCPGWWNDDLTAMAPELATAARLRRSLDQSGDPR